MNNESNPAVPVSAAVSSTELVPDDTCPPDTSANTFCRRVRRFFGILLMYLKLCCLAIKLGCQRLCQRSICCRRKPDALAQPVTEPIPVDIRPSVIAHPEFDAERNYVRQLPAGEKPMTVRGKNYIRGDKSTKVPRAETLYTLSKTFLFKYKEKFNNILETQPATFQSLLDENGSNIFIHYILPHCQNSSYYRSFVPCFSNERSFRDLKDHYASAIDEDPENDDLFSKKQCSEVLYDFVLHYDKDARDRRLKTFAFVPNYQSGSRKTKF